MGAALQPHVLLTSAQRVEKARTGNGLAGIERHSECSPAHAANVAERYVERDQTYICSTASRGADWADRMQTLGRRYCRETATFGPL